MAMFLIRIGLIMGMAIFTSWFITSTLAYRLQPDKKERQVYVSVR
jgi:hypothetical protein